LDLINRVINTGKEKVSHRMSSAYQSPVSAVRSLAPLFLFSLLLIGFLNGCIPYTVGSTAQTLPPDEVTTAASFYIMPGVYLLGDSLKITALGMDGEVRIGVTERSDIGVRFIAAGMGFVVNYKYLLQGDHSGRNSAVSLLTGAGLINTGDHFHFEASLIASGAQDDNLTP